MRPRRTPLRFSRTVKDTDVKNSTTDPRVAPCHRTPQRCGAESSHQLWVNYPSKPPALKLCHSSGKCLLIKSDMKESQFPSAFLQKGDYAQVIRGRNLFVNPAGLIACPLTSSPPNPLHPPYPPPPPASCSLA